MKPSVKDLKEEVAFLKEQLKKAVADYCNLENRVEKEAVALRQVRALSLIDKLLPVLDDLERAEDHFPDKGLQMAVGQFKKVLASEGVAEIVSLGKEFDPGQMDCVAVVPGEKNKVAAVILKGYSLGDKVIRPAKVKVGQGKINLKV